MTKTVHFNGPCPYLLCLETGPHDHPICPECGAVRYGNIFCPTCREHWPEMDAEIQQAITQMLHSESGQHQLTNEEGAQ